MTQSVQIINYLFSGVSLMALLFCKAVDLGLIPGLGRSPGEGNGNSLQYSGLGREEGGGFRLGSACIPVADSFWCLARLIQCLKFKNKIKLKKKWIHHGYACVPHPEPSSLLPPHTIPLGHPSAPAPSIQYHTSNLDWRLISYMMLYMFQCHSPKSSPCLPLPQSPNDV